MIHDIESQPPPPRERASLSSNRPSEPANRLFVDARRRAAPRARQRDIRSIFIPTGEVSDILMTLGGN